MLPVLTPKLTGVSGRRAEVAVVVTVGRGGGGDAIGPPDANGLERETDSSSAVTAVNPVNRAVLCGITMDGEITTGTWTVTGIVGGWTDGVGVAVRIDPGPGVRPISESVIESVMSSVSESESGSGLGRALVGGRRGV